jgi:hypothetical protein
MNLPMRTVIASALLAGSAVLLAPGLAANAQNLAAAAPSAAKPRPGYVVFFERNIIGRADLAEAVKSALVLQGVLPTSIALVGRDDTGPIVRASTGTVEPVSRSVLIAF